MLSYTLRVRNYATERLQLTYLTYACLTEYIPLLHIGTRVLPYPPSKAADLTSPPVRSGSLSRELKKAKNGQKSESGETWDFGFAPGLLA